MSIRFVHAVGYFTRSLCSQEDGARTRCPSEMMNKKKQKRNVMFHALYVFLSTQCNNLDVSRNAAECCKYIPWAHTVNLRVERSGLLAHKEATITLKQKEPCGQRQIQVFDSITSSAPLYIVFFFTPSPPPTTQKTYRIPQEIWPTNWTTFSLSFSVPNVMRLLSTALASISFHIDKLLYYDWRRGRNGHAVIISRYFADHFIRFSRQRNSLQVRLGRTT